MKRRCNLIIQQERKTKELVLLDSNEKEDNLYDFLLIYLNMWTAHPPPSYDGVAALSLSEPEPQPQSQATPVSESQDITIVSPSNTL